MGNKNQMVLKSKERLVVLDATQGKTLWLNELAVFPHGYDGLHIWEAGIVLSRYILLHKDLFKDKRILELGAGVGIAGLSALKYTECKECVLSDYQPQILQNINANLLKNKIDSRGTTARVNWLDYRHYSQQFDVIIGSDVVYFGCPVKELYELIKKATTSNGVVHILIPERKNYAELFLKLVEPAVFQVFKKKLDEAQYRQSPLPNKVEGLKEYNLLVDVDFYMYTLVKNDKREVHMQQKGEDKCSNQMMRREEEKKEKGHDQEDMQKKEVKEKEKQVVQEAEYGDKIGEDAREGEGQEAGFDSQSEIETSGEQPKPQQQGNQQSSLALNSDLVEPQHSLDYTPTISHQLQQYPEDPMVDLTSSTRPPSLSQPQVPQEPPSNRPSQLTIS